MQFPYWGRSARTDVYAGRDIGKKSICAKRQIRDRQSLLDLVRWPIFFSVGFRFSIFDFRFCSFFFLLLLFPLAPPTLCSSKSPGRVDVLVWLWAYVRSERSDFWAKYKNFHRQGHTSILSSACWQIPEAKDVCAG